MTIPIRGQFGEDLTGAIRDAVAPLEVVKLAHVFGTASATVTALNIGDVVVKTWFQVTTAYNAGTTNVITLGNTASASKFLGSGDITEATPAVYPATVPIPGVAETVASNLVLAYAQTGTAATTGAGVAYAVIARASVLDTDTAS